jgi:hypothetical protein
MLLLLLLLLDAAVARALVIAVMLTGCKYV